jgi:hypothetical protein
MNVVIGMCSFPGLLCLAVTLIDNIFVETITVHIVAAVFSRTQLGLPSVIIKSVCWYSSFFAVNPRPVETRHRIGMKGPTFGTVEILDGNRPRIVSKHQYV